MTQSTAFSKLLGFIFLTGVSVGSLQAQDFSPTKASMSARLAGRWKTIDDRTGKPRSIVRIEARGDRFVGFVEQGFPRPGDIENPKCTKCVGENKDKPILGLQILSGLKADGDEFSGGSILDPDDGHTYSCKMKVASDGKSLSLRGYVGIPLLGRSQTWYRVEN